MINYMKKHRKTLFVILPLFFISFIFYLSIYKTELFVSYAFKLFTRGNIKIEKLVFEKGSDYRKGKISLKNVDLYDYDNIKAGEIPKVEIEYDNFKIENINVYKPKVIFIRKDNYYNFAHIFVKINSSDKKLKKEEKKNTYNPILKKINISDADVLYIDKSYTKEIKMRAKNVDSTIEFFKGYSIDINATGNNGEEKYSLNFNTLKKRYDFNIIAKNIKINQSIFQYAYDSKGEITNISGNLNIDFRINPEGYFGKGKLSDGKARYSDIFLPISNVNLDLKFLGEKIKIDGDYLLGDKEKGLFNLEYSKKEGTDINFKFKDLSYDTASSYKYLNDLNLKLNKIYFGEVDVNLKYKDKLKVDIFFYSPKGIEKNKVKIDNIHGNFIYEDEEFKLKNLKSTVTLDIPKNKISKEIVTDLKYKNKLGQLKFTIKDPKKIFSDINLGFDFKLVRDGINFKLNSKLFYLKGNYDYKNKILDLNQDNNFKFKYSLRDKKILSLKGFFNAKLEDKNIVLNMKKNNDEEVEFNGKIKLKEEKKGEIKGKLNLKNYLYNFNFKLHNLTLEIKEKLVNIDLKGEIRGSKNNHLANIDLKKIDYKDEKNKLNIQGIFGELKISKKDKVKILFDGQINTVKIKDYMFRGLKSSLSYFDNEINILNLNNRYLNLSGNYNIKSTLSDFKFNLKNLDEKFIDFKNYSYNIENIYGKIYGKKDNLYSEIKIDKGEIYIKDNIPLNFSGQISYLNKTVFSDDFKINNNVLNFKYYLEKEIGSYDIDIFESDLIKNITGSKGKLIGKLTGNINKKNMFGKFRGTLSQMQYKSKNIPLIYFQGDFKNKKIKLSEITLKDSDRKNIIYSKGYVDLGENNLEIELPNQKLNIQEVITSSNLTGNLNIKGNIKGSFDKINYELFALSDKIKYKENKIDNVKILILGDNKDLKLKEFLINYKNGKINMEGNYNLQNKNYEMNLKSLGVDLDFFNIIFNEYGINDIKGIGKIDLKLFNDGALGNIVVDKFGLALEKYKLYLSNLSGAIKIEKNKLIINKFLGILNGGTVNIKGNILKKDSLGKGLDLDSNNILYNLILDGRNISYSFDDYFDLNFNTRMQFLKNRIIGNVTINNGEIKNILKKDLSLITWIKNFIKEKLMNNIIIEKSKNETLKSKDYFSEDLKINIGFNIDNGIDLNVKETTSYISNLRGKIFGQGLLQGNLKKLNFLGETNIKDGGFLLNGNEFTIDKALILFNNRNEYIPDLNPNVVLVTSSIINSKIFEISLSGLSKNLTFKIRSGDTTSVNTLDSLLNGEELDENRYGNAHLLLTNILGGQISDIVVNPIVEIFKEVFRLPKLRVSSNIIAEQNKNNKEKEETLYGAYLEAQMPLYKEKIFGKVKFNFMGDSNSEKSRESYGLVNYDVNVYNKINKNISWGVGAQKLRDDVEVKRREINYYIELKFEKKFDF